MSFNTSDSAPAPPPYSNLHDVWQNNDVPHERTPLNVPAVDAVPTYGHRRKSWGHIISQCVFWVLIVLVLASLFWQNARMEKQHADLCDPAEKERHEVEWEKERKAHMDEREQWEREYEQDRRRRDQADRDHEEERRRWDQERLEREKEIERERQREREREKEHQRERDRWTHERLEHEREEARQRLEEREWEKQREEHRQEHEKWERERRAEERRRNEYERIRLGLQWEEPRGDSRCYSYGTREYTSRLTGIPYGYSGLEACIDMPITIHGRIIPKPDRCKDMGADGILGQWLVDFDEMGCLPYWGDVYDQGCLQDGSGMHRVEARLWNLQSGDDWNVMCGSTPANIHDRHFDHPKNCEYRGYLYGMVGMWEFDDHGCR